MRYLCFGMPGTGKSTFVKSKPVTQQLRLDLGHNSFKDDKAREKFYRKAVVHTTSELHVISRLTWYYDTYAEYFDPKEVAKYDVAVIFAIPSLELLEHVVVPRVARRDTDSDFPSLYAKNYAKWREGFVQTFQKWKAILGSAKVRLIDLYDEFSA